MILVNSVSVYPKNIALKVGDWCYSASAEVCPLDAACTSVTWYSDNTDVAMVNASSGYFYAKAVGTAKIYAASTDGSDQIDYLTVTVNDTIETTSVGLNRTNVTLEEGTSCTLCATVCPENATNKSIIWSSSDTNIATVNNGVVYGLAKGSAVIKATAADCSGKNASCSVRVTDDTLVTSVMNSPSSQDMVVGDFAYLSAAVTPTEATNQNAVWSSSDANVVTVNETSGLVYAKNAGEATVYATAADGSGQMGISSITVGSPVSSEGITVHPKIKTLGLCEKYQLGVKFSNECASDRTVHWISSHPAIATVGATTGLVTALAKGTTTITASTEGGFIDTCVITVDPREKVTIQKWGDYFDVIFPDGSTWKNIGCDMSLCVNRSGVSMDEPDEYDALFEHEQRYLHNLNQNFSVQQIAYIYRFDPLGIEYFMKNDAYRKAGISINDMSKILFYKDSVYKAIFGEPKQGRFYFTIDNDKVKYGTYVGQIALIFIQTQRFCLASI